MILITSINANHVGKGPGKCMEYYQHQQVESLKSEVKQISSADVHIYRLDKKSQGVL